jgi:hypothetical protein
MIMETIKFKKLGNPLDPNDPRHFQQKQSPSQRFLRVFWPSWQNGQYISDKNPEARTNKQRLFSQKIADIKEVLTLRHGKKVRVLYNRKNGHIIPRKDMSTANRNKLDARNKVAEKQFRFFDEDNHLDAITAALKMPRNIRRTLCRKLGMMWHSPTGYREAEAMIRENIAAEVARF